jgi:hypothetical protein
MARNLLVGTIAGAAGTMALDLTTYGDMLLRGRPASNVPAQIAATVAGAAGIDLAAGGATPEQTESRRNALGALLGYLTGIGIGAAYGLLRPKLRSVPPPLAGVALGLAAMAASDVPIAATGASDPRTWGVSGWLSDLIPHLVYGLVTAATFHVVAGPSE